MKHLMILMLTVLSMRVYADDKVYFSGGPSIVNALSKGQPLSNMYPGLSGLAKICYEHEFTNFHLGASVTAGSYYNKQKLYLIDLNAQYIATVKAKVKFGNPGLGVNVYAGLNIHSSSAGVSLGYIHMNAEGQTSKDYMLIYAGISNGLNLGIYYRYFHWFNNVGVGGEFNPNISIVRPQGGSASFTILTAPVVFGIGYKF